MKFTAPNVEWWPQESIVKQIAKVGRICYKAKGKQPPENLSEKERKDFEYKRDMERDKGFWKSGHRSMYRHGSCYFFVPNESKLHTIYVWSLMVASPYIDYVVKGKQVWISTNMQFMSEHEDFQQVLEPYVIDEDAFIEKALKAQCTEALWLLRMTLVFTTQRIQGESYNRKSPNCIAEQSTRYVNLKKKGGVLICRPHWEANSRWYQRLASHFGYWVAEKVYSFLLFTGLPPEDARGNLTFNTYTIVGYTYNLHEWKHIMDMRLRDTTGRAHKDAKIIAEKVSSVINNRMKEYIPGFQI